MIPVERTSAPEGFEENVRQRGLKWIASRAHANLRFPNYWTWCEPHLREAFRTRCGWAAMSITSGSISLQVLDEDAPLIAAAIRDLHAAPEEDLGEEMVDYRAELFRARARAGASVP